MSKKIIVISAVNLVEAGTLTILRDCLHYLSELAQDDKYKVVALVYDKSYAFYPNIDYIETQKPKKNWIYRLWYEYVTMKDISLELGDVYLWFSLHDTTPNVKSIKQAVYCHNPFPFYKWKWRELFWTPKIVLFSLLSKYVYQINIHNNNFVVVQQRWIKDQFKRAFDLSDSNLIIAKPKSSSIQNIPNRTIEDKKYRFIYAASPNSHKNFECLTAATQILSQNINREFEVLITVKGDENGYARWLKGKWGGVSQLVFAGFMSKDALFQYYANSDALVFPSKAETWGLPISEFARFQKPMLLADLPYAHETAEGSVLTAFFNPDNPNELAQQMSKLMQGDNSFLNNTPINDVDQFTTNTWHDLFSVLLKK